MKIKTRTLENGTKHRVVTSGSRTMSTHPYRNCKEYICIDERGQEIHLWCNYNPDIRHKPPFVVDLLKKIPLLIAYFIIIATILSIAFHIPATVDTSYEDKTIMIEDNLRIIENMSEIRNKCEELYKNTGLTAYILTGTADQLDTLHSFGGNFSSHGFYATKFADKGHILITIRELYDVRLDSDLILHESASNVVPDDIESLAHKALSEDLIKEPLSVETNIINAIDVIIDNNTFRPSGKMPIHIMFFVFGFIIIHAFILLFAGDRMIKYYPKAYPVNKE